MRILSRIISILEFQVGKDRKVYTEDQYRDFARRAMLSAFFLPINTFSYAAKAKKSANPEIVRRAKKAELIALAVMSPFVILILIGLFYGAMVE